MLLGTVLIFAGVFVLGDVMVATLISAIFIGIVAIIAGAFEIIYAFWTKGWGRFLWQIFLGILYVAFGLTLVSEPVSGALTLTFILGLLLSYPDRSAYSSRCVIGASVVGPCFFPAC